MEECHHLKLMRLGYQYQVEEACKLISPAYPPNEAIYRSILRLAHQMWLAFTAQKGTHHGTVLEVARRSTAIEGKPARINETRIIQFVAEKLYYCSRVGTSNILRRGTRPYLNFYRVVLGLHASRPSALLIVLVFESLSGAKLPVPGQMWIFCIED
jgi:hypothetical protein